MIWENNSLPIITLQSTQGNPEVTFTHLQMWMFAHIQYLEYFWWGVWVITLCVILWNVAIKNPSRRGN